MTTPDPQELITDLTLLKALRAAHYAHYNGEPDHSITDMPDDAKAYWVKLAQTAMAYVNVAYRQGLDDGLAEADGAAALAAGDPADPELAQHIATLAADTGKPVSDG